MDAFPDPQQYEDSSCDSVGFDSFLINTSYRSLGVVVAPPYTQVPLDPFGYGRDGIRLVRLEPSLEPEPIRCTLQAYRVGEKCPPYVALSYSWGLKERYADIQLNGVLVPVGRNLWEFLRQMREQRHYVEMWIDALSIDQANVSERNHQVKMMREIYAGAHSVVVWLGGADLEAHSDVAMRFLKMHNLSRDSLVEFMKHWNEQIARAVFSICKREYWKRVWIVQEILLAKDLTVLCGSSQVSWRKVQRFVADLQRMLNRGLSTAKLDALNIVYSPAAAIVSAHSQWDGAPQPLAKLLSLYRNQQATDIRDKVYALHGLADDNASMANDYNVHPKALLVQTIWHANTSLTTEMNPKSSIQHAMRFASMMSEILHVHCPEEDLFFHTSLARGDKIEDNAYELYAREQSRTGPEKDLFGVNESTKPDREGATAFEVHVKSASATDELEWPEAFYAWRAHTDL